MSSPGEAAQARTRAGGILRSGRKRSLEVNRGRITNVRTAAPGGQNAWAEAQGSVMGVYVSLASFVACPWSRPSVFLLAGKSACNTDEARVAEQWQARCRTPNCYVWKIAQKSGHNGNQQLQPSCPTTGQATNSLADPPSSSHLQTTPHRAVVLERRLLLCLPPAHLIEGYGSRLYSPRCCARFVLASHQAPRPPVQKLSTQYYTPLTASSQHHRRSRHFDVLPLPA